MWTRQVADGPTLVARIRAILRRSEGTSPRESGVLTFADLEPEWIESYCDTGDSMDKAGAYGVQGRAAERIERIEAALGGTDRGDRDVLEARLDRLRGIVTWSLETEYHERFTRFDTNLRSLGEAMAIAQAEYDEYVRSRQAATHSYEGYEKPVNRLRVHSNNAIQKIDLLMARQGRMLEQVAVEELVARRGRLENFGDKARFALADSYDRATQAQARMEGQ